MAMTLVRRETPVRDLATRRHDLFDRFFDDWPEALRRPVLLWPEREFAGMRIEEFTEDGTLVARVELPGIDPDKDVEISIDDDMLHIAAERREEEKTEERDYVRRELHYGSLRRDLPLPKGAGKDDVKAIYKDGILEVRVPLPKPEAAVAQKISVTKG